MECQDPCRGWRRRHRLCIVTASRQRLRQLLSNPDAQTSDFWNIFDPLTIQVRAFARANCDGRRCAADEAFESVSDCLAASWNDCTEASRCLYSAIRESGHLPVLPETLSDLDPLLDRGFCRKERTRVKGQCRLLDRFIDRNGRSTRSLALLLGTPEGFRANVCALLREQLAQIREVDSALHALIHSAIGQLPGEPQSCLGKTRDILDRALALVWDRELGPQRRIDPQWLARWTRNRESASSFPEGKSPPGIAASSFDCCSS